MCGMGGGWMMCEALYPAEEGIACETNALKTWQDAEGLPIMVEVRAGEFLMGENERDKFANDTERPSHRVRISINFALGKFPVTVGEFRRFYNDYAEEEGDGLPVV